MMSLNAIRTDVVGSLLRPPALKAARARFDDGAIGLEHFRAIEDEAVLAAIRLQESVGLDVITDGEMRRLNFQDSFGESVEGFDATPSTLRIYERRVEGAAPLQRWDIKELHDHGTAVSHRRPVKSRLRLGHNIPLDEYRFVAQGVWHFHVLRAIVKFGEVVIKLGAGKILMHGQIQCFLVIIAPGFHTKFGVALGRVLEVIERDEEAARVNARPEWRKGRKSILGEEICKIIPVCTALFVGLSECR